MRLAKRIKELFYFPLAYYFRFFAQIRLRRWKPRIIVVTGSSGKTTLLHLIEAQLGKRARYSHGANSSYGIPFDILGLKRKTFLPQEWPFLIFLAPFAAFKAPPKEKIYVAEVDCDRPGEGKFLAAFLRPEVTLWLNVSKTHSANFDKAATAQKFGSTETMIAREFGYLTELTSKLVIANGDDDLVTRELSRTKADIRYVDKARLQQYQILTHGKTQFKIGGKTYLFSYLLPEVSFYGIIMALELAQYLGAAQGASFSDFKLPPGRSSVFQGVKRTTIIDSTYNAPTYQSMKVVLHMFSKIPTKNKWVILGDMIEHGESEREEHEKLAEFILDYNFNRLLFVGRRMSEYAYPKLETLIPHFSPLIAPEVKKFLKPTEVLEYLKTNLEGGETLLFKGAGFLEGVIEHLLENREDAKKLCRREKIWQIRRRQWGL